MQKTTDLRKGSIKRRLTVSTMLTTGLALLLACVVFVTYDQIASRRSLVDALATTAKILGDNTSAALSFNDAQAAEQTLASLRADERVIGAVVYDRQGAVFSTYRKAGTDGQKFAAPSLEQAGHRFYDATLDLFSPIDLAGESQGTVFLRTSLNSLNERMWRFATVAAAVFVTVSVLALLFSTHLMASIYGPISHLSSVVAGVATTRNFAVRAVKQREDELGRLIEGFNEMLDQIQLRDSALEEGRNSLERRVIERTRELQEQIAERERTETALRISEERYSSAFKDASIGMALISPEGKWLKTNLALEGSIGYSSANLAAGTFFEITHGEDKKLIAHNMRQLLEGANPVHHTQIRLVHQDGSIVWVQLHVSVVRDATGVPQYFVAQIQDISARKRAEDELETVHKQLIEASRLSGMAEVATDVLHNVGNALNSVNVSASLVVGKLTASKAPNLAKAAQLLRDHLGDLATFLSNDPRGQMLPGYFEKLGEHLVAEQSEFLNEMARMQKSIEHIKNIVSMQQRYAKGRGVKETVSVVDLIEDSLRMSEGSFPGRSVKIVREFESVPAVEVEKHKVLEILLNLIGNAKIACMDSGREDMVITLRVKHAKERIQISIADNGIGIPAENLTRIFNHGFTTRKSGHGFGLHSGALAATAVGGSLKVGSDGPGYGACFTLELPCAGA